MGSPEDVILYTHQVSPYAQRVHVALVEKGIPFKPVFVDFFNKPAGLLKANPFWATVPTLVHGKNAIRESLVILEYLEEAWPQSKPLLPKDPVARADARFWADYIYNLFFNLQRVGFTEPNSPERKATMGKVPKYYETLEETMIGYSDEGPFFMGDKFEYLDVILLPLASWAPLLEKAQEPIPGPDQLPRLHKWFKAVRNHKSYTEVIASDEENWEIFDKTMKKRLEAAAAAKAANGT